MNRTQLFLSLFISITIVSSIVVNVRAAPLCLSSCPQFSLSLKFSDPSGQRLTPPSSVTLHSGPTMITVTSFTGIMLSAGVWTVSNVTWEGRSNAQSVNASFDLSSGPVNGTLVLRAFNTVVLVVDYMNRPVSGAVVQATLSNTTVRTITTDEQGRAHLGHIPFGLYSVRVNYQGRQMGTWNSDASTTPTLTAMLNINTSPPTLTDPVGMVRDHWELAIAGFLAGFLAMSVAIRRRGMRPKLNRTTDVGIQD